MHKIFLILFATLFASSIYGQRNGNAPYSRYGLGGVVDNSFVALRQMGSINSSYADGFHINAVNPASYASLRSTAFEFGLSAKRSVLTQGNTSSDRIWSGNIDYIALAMPLQNELNELLDRKVSPFRYGMGFTLAPMTNVAYNIQSTEEDVSNGTVLRDYTGKGGLYKFMWGGGVKYKKLSLGTNLGYAFGNISHQRRINFEDVANSYDNVYVNNYTANGFLWDVGLLYTLTLNEKKAKAKKQPYQNITLGVRFSNATKLSTNSSIERSAYRTSTVFKTLLDTTGIKGNALLPSSFGAGVNYRYGNKFVIGVDYKKANWSNYYNDATQEVKKTLKTSNTVSLGGYFRPKYNSYTSYWNRIYYRFGAYASTDPVAIDGEQSKSFGAMLGLGLPFVYKRKISHANIGIELGRTGSGTKISESYMRLSVGFTFNDDQWFIKRKYN